MADREKLIELQEKWFSCDDYVDLEKFADFMIANDVTVQRHGKWIHDVNNLYGCSECMQRETMSPKKLKNYCPNCGAKMDGEKK